MCNISKIIVDACCFIGNAHLKGRSGRGKTSCGILIIDSEGKEYERAKYLGEMTVPQGEFEALIFGIDVASGILRRDQHVEIWMDSELVVQWMNKRYRLKKEHIRPLYDRAYELAQRFDSIQYFHHSRDSELAKRADRLAHLEYEKHNK